MKIDTTENRDAFYDDAYSRIREIRRELAECHGQAWDAVLDARLCEAQSHLEKQAGRTLGIEK